PEGLEAYEYFQAAYDTGQTITDQMRRDFIIQIYRRVEKVLIQLAVQKFRATVRHPLEWIFIGMSYCCQLKWVPDKQQKKFKIKVYPVKPSFVSLGRIYDT
ncbi:MAG: hypothetical protein R6X11_07915, partial [Desulfonatronovibrio sp.]